MRGVPLTTGPSAHSGACKRICTHRQTKQIRLRTCQHLNQLQHRGGYTSAHRRHDHRSAVATLVCPWLRGYGLRDHKWKIPRRGRVLHSSTRSSTAASSLVHSLRFTSLYDIDQLGQRYVYTNADNLFLSLKRMEDTRLTYQRRQQLEYTSNCATTSRSWPPPPSNAKEGTPLIPLCHRPRTEFRPLQRGHVRTETPLCAGRKSSTRARPTACQSTSTHRYSELTHICSERISREHVHHQPHRVALLPALVALGIRLHRCSCDEGGHVWSSTPYMNLHAPQRQPLIHPYSPKVSR